MSAIIHEDAVIHYEVLGHGKPVIFLHSWIGSWRYWFPTMQFASSRYGAYAIDLWGFGTSKKEYSRYSIENQVDLLKGFIDQFGVTQISLVGHGLGSIIGIYFASDFPQIVERIMLISFPMGCQSLHPRISNQSPADSADWLFGCDSKHLNSKLDAKKTDHEAILYSIDQFKEVNWRQLINRLTIPSLWAYGKNDRAVKLPIGEELDSLPDKSHWLVFEKSGHFPMLDEPGIFNRLLMDFINLPSGLDPDSLEIKQMWKRRVR